MRDIREFEHRAEQSNPFSTGGGGVNYEISVQTYFTASMLLEWKIINLKAERVEKIKLQGRYDGYDTDDCIIFGDNGNKMLCQIKHSISITKNNTILKEVIKSAWNDFNNSELFNIQNDCIDIIVSSLSKVDIESLKTINIWANSCENESEFVKKIYTNKFSSEEKKKKYEIIKYHLTQEKSNITDKEIWQFLKIFSITVLDVDTPNSYIKSSFMSALNNLTKEDNFGNKLYCYVADKNQSAGTIVLKEVKKELNFNIIASDNEIKNDRKKLQEHTNLILENMHSDVAGITIKREEEIDRIRNLLEENQMVIITGDRGVGKSGIAKEYWEKYCKTTYSLAIRAEELNYPNIQNVFGGIGINSNVTDLFNIITLCNDKIIFIESLEKILELENNKAFLDFLAIISKHPEWKMVATTRNYAIQQIIINFISEYGIRYDIVEIEKFKKEEINEFIDKKPEFKIVNCNNEILELIRNPFYLSSVHKIIRNGYILTQKDNKDSIKNSIWENIIKKNSERIDGLPYKREKTFIEVALKRSSSMAYAVDMNQFDLAVIAKLEEDGLVSTNNGLVYLTHDVFEDWAIEKYIEKQYQVMQHNIKEFLDNIGCEQSMCRAYRLWLNEKDDNFINNYIKDIFATDGLENIWYDETMAAIIFSNRVDKILNLLEKKLLENNCELLKRLCFMIRVTAKKPDMNLFNLAKVESVVKKSSFITLKPYGESWTEIIKFLYKKRDELSNDMNNHCFNILKEWSSIININEDLSEVARDAGLLALFVINKIKDDYNQREMVKKIFSIAMMTYKSISNEFDEFVEKTVFNNQERKEHHYIGDIAEQIYNSIDTCYIAKNNPDILIKVARREWFVQENQEEIEDIPFYAYDDFDENKLYGLKSCSRHDYFPPSGKREPFRSLFMYCPKKAIDFVIELCNICAETYIKNSLKKYEEKEKTNILKNIVYDIKKDNGTIIKQYGIANFWVAYRGMSNTPYLIESALMALENKLIEHFEYFKENKNEIDYCIDYILSNSNSVFTTSVLSSVSIPYYKSLKKSALLLLQNNDFFDMDMGRRVREMGEKELNWFAMQNDVLKNLYVEDRKKAATREWRHETLETLCTKLQFTELRDDVWKIIDMLNEKNKNISNWKFRMNRMDTRTFKFELDEDNNQIICTSGDIKDKELIQISEQTKKKSLIMNRFFGITHWVSEAKKGNYDFLEYKNQTNLIKEVKELLIVYNKLEQEEKSVFYMVAIIECISIIYIKYRKELHVDEKKWCKDFILKKFYEYDQSLDKATINGRVDNTGLWLASEAFSCICEEIEEKEQKKLLIAGLTCCDLDIRLHTAIGIGKYLWEFNENLARTCMDLVNYFDTLDSKERLKFNTILYGKKTKKINSYSNWIKNIRKKLLRINNFSELIVDKIEKSLYSVTEQMLMLPEQYDSKMDIEILNILNRVILAEKDKNDYRKENKISNEGYFEVLQYYSDFFGKYFYQMGQTNLNNYFDSIKNACNNAPYFMKWTVVHYKLLAEQSKNTNKYWTFFNMISDIMVEISNELAQNERYKYDKRNEILSEYIYLNTPWQPIDFENPPIEGGIQYICEFTKKANSNVMVFEGISSLMYYFPKLILEEGLKTFEVLSEDNIKRNLEKSKNSIFYLENILHSYVINLENNTISRNLYNICEKILNSLVESASSKAYYTREYLIKSKKIM